MIESSPEHDEIARQIVDSAFAVHKALGAGLLKSAYEQCLAYELRSRSLRVALQMPLPVQYREVQIEIGFRIDMVVNDMVLIEVKAVERILAVHEAQLLTYLKLSGKHLGLLINFNVPLIKDGIRRLIG
jgi:GxxExxY protein